MANQRAQMIKVPLNGVLNFSSLKTEVVPYNGFNDLNSPIYGDTLSPLYMAERDTKSAGNDRPFIDKEGILRDKDGYELLNVKDYKGLKRTELKVPSRALAVYDQTHYVDVNEDYGYTTIFSVDENNNTITKALPYEAIAAAYSETKAGTIFVAEQGILHAFDFNTLEELSSVRSVDNIKANIITFYDPLSDWQVVSMYEPFGDWEYHKDAKFSLVNAVWNKWNTEKQEIERQYDDAINNSVTSKATYEKLFAEQAQIQSEIQVSEAWEDYYLQWATFYFGLYYNSRYQDRASYQAYLEWNAEYERQKDKTTEIKNRLSTWNSVNGETLNNAKADYEKNDVAKVELKKQLDDKIAQEPKKYQEDKNNPNYFRGKVSRTFNFIFDKTTKTFTEKRITIPWSEMSLGSYGPDADSYIITGIYDMHLKSTEDGKWIENTDEDYIRYRLGVVPHDIVISSGPDSEERYFFTLNYTPKIYFRQRDVNQEWKITKNPKVETKTYLLNNKNGVKRTEEDIFFSGTGKNGKSSTWCKVEFQKPSDPKLEIDLNRFNLFHDFGEAKYDMYSPFTSGKDVTGNCYPSETSDGSRGITKYYYSYDVCSNNLDYIKPTTNGEEIVPNVPKNIFREIVNNGIINNLSVTEDPYQMGTLLEAPNSINPIVPVFYRNGKDGSAAVFKSEQGKWISIETTPSVEELKIVNDDYAVLYTTKNANCVRLADKKIKHYAPDWNNRFSLVGSPYLETIQPLKFPAVALEEQKNNISDMFIGSGVNINFEVTEDPVMSYKGVAVHILANEDNITPVGFVSKYDDIDYYFTDFIASKSNTPVYYNSVDVSYINYALYNNIDLEDVSFPAGVVNVPGVFCEIKPSNFGRFFIDDGSVFYGLLMYNGRVYYGYYTSTLLDDVKELFMVQGRTFAVTKSDYIYSIFLDQNGSASMTDAMVNIKGLKYCGSVPEMAIFYSPMDRTLKSFTADRTLQDLQHATAIDNVYYTTYNPQTNSVYICTNNGIYIYAATNQYRLPINNVKEIYFGGSDNKHTYISFINEKGEAKTRDYLYDKIFGLRDFTKAAEGQENAYEIQPLILETRYYGSGSNTVANTDCVYFRLYSDVGPIDAYLKISESTITDDVYTTETKTLKVGKKDWNKLTNTAYVRYQPKNQKSVGLSIRVETNCSISEINFGVGNVETVSLSRPTLNM